MLKKVNQVSEPVLVSYMITCPSLMLLFYINDITIEAYPDHSDCLLMTGYFTAPSALLMMPLYF